MSQLDNHSQFPETTLTESELSSLGMDAETIQDWMDYYYVQDGERIYPFLVALGQSQRMLEAVQENILGIHPSELRILDIGCGAVENKDYEKETLTNLEESGELTNPDNVDVDTLDRAFEPWQMRAFAYLGIGTSETRIGIDNQSQGKKDSKLFSHVKGDLVKMIEKGLDKSLAKKLKKDPEVFHIIVCNNLFTANRYSESQTHLFQSSPGLLQSLLKNNANNFNGLHKNATFRDTTSQDDSFYLLWALHDKLAIDLIGQIHGLQLLGYRNPLMHKGGVSKALGLLEFLLTDFNILRQMVTITTKAKNNYVLSTNLKNLQVAIAEGRNQSS